MKHILRKSLLLLSIAGLALAGCDKSAAELEELRSELGSLTERVVAIENTQIKALEEQIASVEKEIASLQNADKVLSDGVSALEGKMAVVSADLAKLKESVSALDASSEELSEEIETINAKLTQIETKITSILTSIEELKAKVDSASAALKLSYIPKYADNNERVLYTRDVLAISGTATLSFTVRPASAAESLAKDWKTSLGAIAVCTLTKADAGESVELSISGASAKDGKLSVNVAVDNLGKDFILGNAGAALALDVTYGGAQTVTDYVNLTPYIPEEKSFITYLLEDFDSDGDGKVNADEITKLTITSSYNLTSESLNAILSETPALTTLNCSGNKLTSLDLSKNPALTSLDCSNNNLTSIDLSKNEKLTTVDLTGNANLTKVVVKSSDWFDACSIKTHGCSALFYLPDGTQMNVYLEGTTVIDGKTWMDYNVGAIKSNPYGSRYNFDNAQTACPTGWRVPTRDELSSLSANYSDWTTYLGMSGRWFSGSQTYSASVSAIFLPTLSSSASYGGSWSSTEFDSSYAYNLYFYSGIVYVYYNYRSSEWSVRCLKD